MEITPKVPHHNNGFRGKLAGRLAPYILAAGTMAFFGAAHADAHQLNTSDGALTRGITPAGLIAGPASEPSTNRDMTPLATTALAAAAAGAGAAFLLTQRSTTDEQDDEYTQEYNRFICRLDGGFRDIPEEIISSLTDREINGVGISLIGTYIRATNTVHYEITVTYSNSNCYWNYYRIVNQRISDLIVSEKRNLKSYHSQFVEHVTSNITEIVR